MARAQRLMLWVAQGFGVGRIPVAPGTFGSVLGLAWLALLLSSHSFLLLLFGATAGFGFSVWLCGEGERLLGKKDPGSVVLDEVTAMPVCFISWLALFSSKHGCLPGIDEVFPNHWMLVVAVFVGFRFFDVLKPWPVRQSQALPAGWGITVDDFLAAMYVNIAVVGVHLVNPLV